MATIVICEDNPANRALAELVLTESGHVVHTAGDGDAGLRLIRELHPDLVLMDIQMPGLDGLEATRRLRADPATVGVRIVALTAHTMQGDAERILAAGCDAYIAKPFRYRDFLARVRELLVDDTAEPAAPAAPTPRQR